MGYDHFIFKLIFVLCSYLIGCLTIGYYLVKAIKGQDIRFLDTGSTGARNVGRQLGVFGFLVTFLWDFAKGYFIIAAARYFSIDPIIKIFAMNAVVIGHIWPVQLGFKGGKGFSTASGLLFAMNAPFFLILLLPLTLFFCFLQNLIVSGMLTALFAPVLGFFLIQSRTEIIGIAFLSFFILSAHRSDIKDLIRSLSYESVRNTHI